MDSDIDVIWPQIREAFALYGRRLGPVCGASRRKLIKKRLAEGYEPDDLIRAVHGYVWFHEGLDPKPGETFNPRKWFDPDSVFKEARFDTRVELGDQGKWVYVDPREAHERAVREKQERARKRVEAARHGIRAV